MRKRNTKGEEGGEVEEEKEEKSLRRGLWMLLPGLESAKEIS